MVGTFLTGAATKSSEGNYKLGARFSEAIASIFNDTHHKNLKRLVLNSIKQLQLRAHCFYSFKLPLRPSQGVTGASLNWLKTRRFKGKRFLFNSRFLS